MGRRSGRSINRIRLLVALAASSAMLGALVSVPIVRAETGFGDPEAGQRLFQNKGCVQCHAVRGTGGRIGPDLGRKAVRSSFFEIVAGMWNHSHVMDEKMREFQLLRPTFEQDELLDLVSFLYFLNYFDEPGNERVGRTLFTRKHCIECHRVGNEGGSVGPSLDSIPRGMPPLRIAQALWNHGPVMSEAMRSKGLSLPQFANGEIVDLFAFLRSHGQRGMTPEFQSAGDPEKGMALFRSKGCRRCHSIFGTGGNLGPDLGRAELRGSVTQIAGKMWNHWPSMMQAMESLGMRRPEFRDNDLADLFAYIFIARYDGQPGDASRGAKVYRMKGCATCHGASGEGQIGPPIRQMASNGSKEELMRRMWNHAPEMWGSMTERRISWPRFEGSELADLFTALASGLPEGAAAEE